MVPALTSQNVPGNRIIKKVIVNWAGPTVIFVFRQSFISVSEIIKRVVRLTKWSLGSTEWAKLLEIKQKKNIYIYIYIVKQKMIFMYPKLLGSVGELYNFPTRDCQQWASWGNGSQCGEEGRLETNVTKTLGKFLDLHEAQFPLLCIHLPQIREPMPSMRTEYAFKKC